METETIDLIKATFSAVLEEAGENGITEGQAEHEISSRYKTGYYETLDILRSIYKEIGAERTPEHTGNAIFYRKKKKQPEESAAVTLAKKLGRQTMSEKERLAILNQYRK